MAKPILVLQYPDPRLRRTVALAATRDGAALRAFKRATLAEARLSAQREDDDLLRFQGEAELVRLQAILGELIPDAGVDGAW